jgi:hypothetical protein
MKPQTPQEPTTEETRKTLVTKEEISFDPGHLQRTLAKFSADASTGVAPPSMRKRRLTMTVPIEACRLDTHDKPFKLTLEELASGEKEAILDRFSAEDSPIKLGIFMVKAAIAEVNGYRCAPHESEFIWSTLSDAGQQKVMELYQEHCMGADPEMEKNLEASVVIS